MTGRRGATAVVLAALVVVSVFVGPASGLLGTGATGVAAAQETSTYAVSQGAQCVEVSAFGDGSQTVQAFYDYRTDETSPSGAFSSYGTTALQDNQVSHLFVYHGSQGDSLVFLHDKVGAGESEGGAVTMTVSQLPASGDQRWPVQDDFYAQGAQDDNWNFTSSTTEVDWMWAPNRTDGGAYRGLDLLASGDEIRIDAAWGEDSWAFQERDPRWPRATDDVAQWDVLVPGSGSGGQVAMVLDKDAPVTVRKGGCGGAPPSASLSAQPATASVGESVTFDASGSSDDGTIVEYRWDFDGDGTTDSTTESATTTASYDVAGTYDARVTVVDDDGDTDTANATVTVEDTQAPAANATVPDAVTVGETFTADASASTDDGAIVDYAWDFGDGTTKSGQSVTHSYGATGTYDVTLTVTDSGGNTDSVTETITVRQPDTTAPSASLSVDPATAEVGQTVTLDASNSSDDRGIVEYRWDFDGDGTVDATTATATTTHAYDAPGSVTASVEVVDGGGNSDVATAAVTVQDTTPPDAQAAIPDTVTVNSTFVVNGTPSSDNHRIASYSWDFGDGAVAPDRTAAHSYDAVGTYQVTLTVTDPSGNQDTYTESITAVEPDTTDPVAALSADPANADVGQTVTLDASNSTDNRNVVEYRWDVDGDGQVDRTTTSPTIQRSYGAAGTFPVTVTVVDGNGNTDDATASVAVTDTTKPTVSVDLPDSVHVGQSFTADASGSTDDQGIASVEWDFGDGTTKTGATVSHAYGATGNYTVTVTVTDASGNAATETRDVTVTKKPDQPPTAKIAASKTTVQTGSSVRFDAGGSTDDGGPLRYEWDLDGDGSFEVDTGTGPAASRPYFGTGTRTVRVKAIDDAGQADVASTTITVVDTVEPSAKIRSWNTMTAGKTYVLAATDVADNSGSVARIQWYHVVDGNRFPGPTGKRVEIVFSDPGTHTVLLEVFDGNGNSYVTSKEIEVVESGGPEDPSPPGDGDDGDGDGDGDTGDGDTGDQPGATQPDVVQVDVDHAASGHVTAAISNARPGDGLLLGLPDTPSLDGPLATVDALSLTMADAESADLAIRTRGEPPEGVDPVDVPGVTAVQYVETTDDVEAFESASITLAVPRERLAAAEGDVEALGAFRLVDGNWSAVNATVVGETEDAYEVRIETDGLSTLALGFQRPATEVASLEAVWSPIQPGESVIFAAFVENAGIVAGNHTVELRVDGEVVRTREVRVEAGSTARINFEVSFDEPGEYTASAGNHSATLAVEATDTPAGDDETPTDETPEESPDDTPTDGTPTDGTTTAAPADDGGQPGFGVGAAVVALLAAALLAHRRRE